MAGRMSRRVLSGFPGVLPKGEALGNPVRADLCALPDPAQRYGARAAHCACWSWAVAWARRR